MNKCVCIYIYIYIYINYLIVRVVFEPDFLKEEQAMQLSYKTLGYKSLSMFIDRYGYFVEGASIYTLLGL